MTKKTKTILIDFDGTICQYDGWKGAAVIEGKPNPGAVAAILKYSAVFEVVIFSTRAGTVEGRDAIELWCSINLPDSLRGLSITNIKRPAILCIDDRSWLFDGRWPSVNEIDEFLPYYKEGRVPTITVPLTFTGLLQMVRALLFK